MFSSIPGLYSLDISSTHTHTLTVVITKTSPVGNNCMKKRTKTLNSITPHIQVTEHHITIFFSAPQTNLYPLASPGSIISKTLVQYHPPLYLFILSCWALLEKTPTCILHAVLHMFSLHPQVNPPKYCHMSLGRCPSHPIWQLFQTFIICLKDQCFLIECLLFYLLTDFLPNHRVVSALVVEYSRLSVYVCLCRFPISE